MGMVSSAILSTPLPIFLCSALPPTAPSAAPIAVAASSGEGEESDDEADAGKPGCALLDRMVALFQRDSAVQAFADHDRTPQALPATQNRLIAVSYTHLRAHEPDS